MQYEIQQEKTDRNVPEKGLCNPISIESWTPPPLDLLIKELEAQADDIGEPVEYKGIADIKFTALPSDYFELKINQFETVDR